MAKDQINDKYKDAAGKKWDGGKLRWDLVPWEAFEQVVERFTHGAIKYGPNNWKEVDDAEDRYFAALMRHLVAHRKGELYDPDFPDNLHISAACWNALVLIYLTMKRIEKERNSKFEDK
ncbi:MAG: hypothetical protein J5691_00070 [Bacilli bacterium]|nr:hypothetical protein [Bacilli bacterium]